jgi:hypothetical protein
MAWLVYGKDHWSFALRGSYRIAKNYHNAADGWVYNTNFRTTNISFSTNITAPVDSAHEPESMTTNRVFRWQSRFPFPAIHETDI